jgi:hypothetical protein
VWEICLGRRWIGVGCVEKSAVKELGNHLRVLELILENFADGICD